MFKVLTWRSFVVICAAAAVAAIAAPIQLEADSSLPLNTVSTLDSFYLEQEQFPVPASQNQAPALEPDGNGLLDFMISPKGFFSLLLVAFIAYALGGLLPACAIIGILVLGLVLKNPYLTMGLIGLTGMFMLINKLSRLKDKGAEGKSGRKPLTRRKSSATAEDQTQADNLRVDAAGLDELAPPAKRSQLNDLLTISSTGGRIS